MGKFFLLFLLFLSVASPISLSAEESVKINKYSCGIKTRCSQMRSCEEAMFYYKHCGLYYLDGDFDGVPCENLCVGGVAGWIQRSPILKFLINVLIILAFLKWIADKILRIKQAFKQNQSKLKELNPSKAIKAIKDENTYRVKGRTYPLREEFKKYGARWNASERAWEIKGLKLKLLLLNNLREVRSVKFLKEDEVVLK